MAEASSSSSSFDQWIRSLLNELQSNNDDMSDFVQYLMGIVTSDCETDEEKLSAISELLADLDLKHDHNIDNLSKQILDRWYQSQNEHNHQINSTKTRVETAVDDDAINNALINAMNQMESTAKQQRPSNDTNSKKSNDDIALKKHKSHVLAKYSEVSEEELDYDDEESTGNNLFHNTNAQDVDDRERKSRESQQEAHKKQQEKNKVDAQNQKQKDDERKKKAQQRAQKQERRR